MFTPRYSITPQLLTNLQEIERLYGRLEATQAPQNLLLNLERDNLIQSTFASNSIEGNPLSQTEVTNLLLGDRTPTNRDEKEVTNYFNILKTLSNMQAEDFSNNLMLDMHRDLMTGVADEIKGQIRSQKIVVGKYDTNGQIIIKHDPPYHDSASIISALSDMNVWINTASDSPVLKAGIFHHQFVYIHPFADGNGRTCRLLTALVLLKHNYLINKYFVLDDYYDIDRISYSDSLHSADNGDKTHWLEYFTEGIKYSLESSLGKIQSGLAKLTFDIRPSQREQDVLRIIQNQKEINSADLVKELSISRQQAFNLLKSLVEKGFLIKKGSTKSSFYVLK